jgi:hypothetical protein
MMAGGGSYESMATGWLCHIYGVEALLEDGDNNVFSNSESLLQDDWSCQCEAGRHEFAK